ncbi:hypothetical protein B0H13DRAFT_1880668 [Mycena leptocephala]|nr:hypothetical protein B0H13DRAFT_1880668 [Mycena leptocephala]
MPCSTATGSSLCSLVLWAWDPLPGSEPRPTPQHRCLEVRVVRVYLPMCRIAGAWEAGFTLLRGILHWRRADHSPCVDCFVIDVRVHLFLLTKLVTHRARCAPARNSVGFGREVFLFFLLLCPPEPANSDACHPGFQPRDSLHIVLNSRSLGCQRLNFKPQGIKPPNVSKCFKDLKMPQNFETSVRSLKTAGYPTTVCKI